MYIEIARLTYVSIITLYHVTFMFLRNQLDTSELKTTVHLKKVTKTHGNVK